METPFKDIEDEYGEDEFGLGFGLDHSIFSDDFMIYGH